MSDPQFFQTKMGRIYYDVTLPELVRQLARLNVLLERLADRLEARSKDDDAAP